MREVVVRGGDYHPDHQIHETDDSGSHRRTTLGSRRCLGALRPAQADVSDRRYRLTMGPVASSRRPRTVVYFLSTLSFRSSTTSCALSTAESSLPLSLPLSSWRSPSRLVSSSPVTAPTACFARPAALSVFSPIAGLLRSMWIVAETRRLATTNQAKHVDGQTESGRTSQRSSPRSTGSLQSHHPRRP